MTGVVLLDAGPLGMITNPKSSPETEDCKNWLAGLAFRGVRVVIPEIADYEVRRESIRAEKIKGLARLDALKGLLGYAPITTQAMLRAAGFRAAARSMGRQSSDDSALDADMILCAQAVEPGRPGDDVSIATTNPRHLTLFVEARNWRDIV